MIGLFAVEGLQFIVSPTFDGFSAHSLGQFSKLNVDA